MVNYYTGGRNERGFKRICVYLNGYIILCCIDWNSDSYTMDSMANHFSDWSRIWCIVFMEHVPRAKRKVYEARRVHEMDNRDNVWLFNSWSIDDSEPSSRASDGDEKHGKHEPCSV